MLNDCNLILVSIYLGSKTFVSSIAGSIAAGIIIWYLTQSGGILNPAPETFEPVPMPDVIITNHNSGWAIVDEWTTPTVSVYNQGNGAATNCRIYWWPEGREVDKWESSTYQFGLTPKQGRDDEGFSSGYMYKQTGTYDTVYRVYCDNFISPYYHETVKVITR